MPSRSWQSENPTTKHWERYGGGRQSSASIGRRGVWVGGNSGGSAFTDEGGGCTVDEFLDGQLNDAVVAELGDEVLDEMLAEASRLTGRSLASSFVSTGLARVPAFGRARKHDFEIGPTGVRIWTDADETPSRVSLQAFLDGALHDEVQQRRGPAGLDDALALARKLVAWESAHGRYVERAECEPCAKIGERCLGLIDSLPLDNLPPDLEAFQLAAAANGRYDRILKCRNCGTYYGYRDVEQDNSPTSFPGAELDALSLPQALSFLGGSYPAERREIQERLAG